MRIEGIENVNESLSTHYLIYKITNNLNGKYYIGQHKTNNVYDDYAGSGTYIRKAEMHEGISSFTKTILFDFDNFDEMNNKEIELVQLSNCFPYDQMSYNLIPGGDGWNLTPEVCKQRGETQSQNYWNKSETERQAYKKDCSRRALKREKNKTQEQRDNARKAQRETWANKSEQEIQVGVSKWRDSMSKHTKEEKAKITRKRLATLNSRPEKEKKASREKFSRSIASRSEERKAEIGKKHSDSLKVHYRKHPEHAKEHSKRMSGKGNPSYGKKWMNNGKELVLVKKEEIQSYLDNGYTFGWPKHKLTN